MRGAASESFVGQDTRDPVDAYRVMSYYLLSFATNHFTSSTS
jgi:hypothetical protein